MTSSQDFHLEPMRDAFSKVVCNYCQQPIGQVKTAEFTPTGTQTDVTEDKIELEARLVVSEHLPACPRKSA